MNMCVYTSWLHHIQHGRVEQEYRTYHHISTLGINCLCSCSIFEFSPQDHFHNLLIFDRNVVFADIRVGHHDAIDDNDVIAVRHFPEWVENLKGLSTRDTKQYTAEIRAIVISDDIIVAQYELDRVKKVLYLCPATPPTLSLSTP